MMNKPLLIFRKFHVCIQGLVALEMGSQGDNDVADNIFESVEAGPILCHAAEPPNDAAPLLHIGAPHHPLSEPSIQKVALHRYRHCNQAGYRFKLFEWMSA